MKIFTRYFWRNKWYKTKQFLNIAPEPSSASPNDVMALLGDTPPKPHIDSLIDWAETLREFIDDIPTEGGDEWDARMSHQLTKVKHYTNLIGESYGLH